MDVFLRLDFGVRQCGFNFESMGHFRRSVPVHAVRSTQTSVRLECTVHLFAVVALALHAVLFSLCRSAVTSLQFLENGLVVTSSDDGTVKLWDSNQGSSQN